MNKPQFKFIQPRSTDCPACGKNVPLRHIGGGCFSGACECGLSFRGSLGDGGGERNAVVEMLLSSWPKDYYGTYVTDLTEEQLERCRLGGAKRGCRPEPTVDRRTRPGKLFR